MMSKWYSTTGRLGTITVFSERSVEKGVRGPCAYLVGKTLWANGPDMIDTDNLPANEVAQMKKCWPDVVTKREKVTTKPLKDGGNETTKEPEEVITEVWHDELEKFLTLHAPVMGLTKKTPVRPVTIDSLTTAEVDLLRLRRTEAALKGEVVPDPPAQKVKTGQRMV